MKSFGLRLLTRIVTTAAALGAMGAPATTAGATAAPADPSRNVTVSQLAVAADYPTSHAVYATVQDHGVTSLLRSGDGGATWVRATARGWQPGQMDTVRLAGQAVLANLAGPQIGISHDGGESFATATAPGTVNALAGHGQTVDAVGVDGSGRPFVASLTSGQAREVPGAPDLPGAVLYPSPAYGNPAAGVPAAIAIGADRDSKQPRMERCDASLACGQAVPIAGGGAALFSPAFDADLTLFLLTPSGLERSTDGGRSIAPVTVAPPSPGSLATVVTAMAFSPDFDARTGGGEAFAAVLGAAREGSGGRLTGGVYLSRDGGVSWSRVGAPTALAYGASSVALAPDGRVLAGSMRFAASPGGVSCSADQASWAPACPAYAGAAAHPGIGSTAEHGVSLAGSGPGTGSLPHSAPGAAPRALQVLAGAGSPAPTGHRQPPPLGVAVIAILMSGGFGAFLWRRLVRKGVSHMT